MQPLPLQVRGPQSPPTAARISTNLPLRRSVQNRDALFLFSKKYLLKRTGVLLRARSTRVLFFRNQRLGILTLIEQVRIAFSAWKT